MIDINASLFKTLLRRNNAPANRTEHRINGSFGRVMWVADEGPVLRLVEEGGGAGDAWQMQPDYLLKVCPWPPERFN